MVTNAATDGDMRRELTEGGQLYKILFLHQSNTTSSHLAGLAEYFHREYPEAGVGQPDGRTVGEIKWMKVEDHVHLCNCYGQRAPGGADERTETSEDRVAWLKQAFVR